MSIVKFVTADGSDTKNEAGEVTQAARRIELEFNFGSTLEEAIELYGKDVVFSAYLASAKVDAQALVRRYLKSNVPAVEGVSVERPYEDAEIAAKLAAWKPGIKSDRSAVSTEEKALAMVGKMTEAQKAAFIAQLMEQATA